MEKKLIMPIYDITGKKKGTMALPKEIFSSTAKESLLAHAVHVHLTNKRQGTVSTKTRGEVRGSTRKIYRQKGTGRARHGAHSAPIFVGGGVVGGPKPKKYSLKINKKQKRRAFFGALTWSFKQGNLLGIENESLRIKPKTKTIVDFLNNLEVSGQKILFVLPKLEKNNLVLAARNISNLEIKDARSLNTLDVLKAQKVIFVKESLEVLKKHYEN